MKYIALDVDTPNYADNRMSAVGVAAMNPGPFVGTYNLLFTHTMSALRRKDFV